MCIYEENVTLFVLFKQVQVVPGSLPSELSRPDPLFTRLLFPHQGSHANSNEVRRFISRFGRARSRPPPARTFPRSPLHRYQQKVDGQVIL